MTLGSEKYALSECCWHERHKSPCRIVDRDALWGKISYRVWLPGKETIVRVQAMDLRPLCSFHPTVEHIQHASSATNLLEALDEGLRLSRIQTGIAPVLSHQLHALECAMDEYQVRYPRAYEEGFGKTIDAYHIMHELHLRGTSKIDGAEECMPDLVAVLILRVDDTLAALQ